MNYNPVEVSIVYCVDEEDNTLAVCKSGGEDDTQAKIGAALRVIYDHKSDRAVLAFRRADGTPAEVRTEGFDPADRTYAELGAWAVKAGYPAEPGMEFFVGLFILERLEELWSIRLNSLNRTEAD